jgi:hypothetical protein
MIVHHERVDAAMEKETKPLPFIMLIDAPKVIHTSTPEALSLELATETCCHCIRLSPLQVAGNEWSENAATSVRSSKVTFQVDLTVEHACHIPYGGSCEDFHNHGEGVVFGFDV